MATFKDQIEAITGLAAGDGSTAAPTTTEYSTWLTDGAKEVIERLSVGKPEALVGFTTSTTVSDANGTPIQSSLVFYQYPPLESLLPYLQFVLFFQLVI